MARIECSEKAIKAKVIEKLKRSARFGHKPVLASEFCIGKSGVRADLVLATRGVDRELIGIEIKSAIDTLQRLPRQIEVYSKFFDRVVIVAAARHIQNIRAMAEPGVEIWEVERSGTIALVRPGAAIADPKPLLDLMTQRDVRRYRGLIAQGEMGERDAFFAAFEDRHGAPSSRFWELAKSSAIREDHLAELSRFSTIKSLDQTDTLTSQFASWADLEAA